MIPWDKSYSTSILIGVFAALVYSKNIFADFVYDDRPAILNNDDVLGHSSWYSLLLHNDFWGNPIALKGSHKSYRPLITATFRLQHWIHGGGRPDLFHVINILIHVINSILVRSLANILLDKNDSLFPALLFSCHPITTEAVCSIVGRADLLATTFTILSILWFRKGLGVKGSIALGVAGVLCKETAIVILPILMVYDVLMVSDKKTFKRVREMLFGLAVICYFRMAINNFQTPSFSKSDNPTAHESSLYIRFLNFTYLPFFHFQLLVFPKILCFDWSIPKIESMFDFRFLGSLIFYGVLLIFTISNFRRSNSKPLFFLSLMILPHILSSNLITYVGFVAAERILYLPAVGYSILLGYCIKKLKIPKTLKLTIIVGLLTIYTSRTLSRIEDWDSEENLFKSALPINPVKAHANLGHIYASRNFPKLAKFHYLSALKLRPNMADTWYNLGILLNSENTTEAINCYYQAIKFRPNFAAAHLNLALLLWEAGDQAGSFSHLDSCLSASGENLKSYQTHLKMQSTCAFNKARFLQKQGKLKEAIRVYEMALHTSSNHIILPILNSLGSCHSQLGDYNSAEAYISQAMVMNHPNSYLTMAQLRVKQNRSYEADELIEKALGLAPTSATVHQNAAWVAQQRGDFNRSFHFFKLALSIDKNHLESLRGIADLLREHHRFQESEPFFKKIVEFLPNSYDSHANYGAILHANQKYIKALEHYEKALLINPSDKITKDNLEKLLRIIKKSNRTQGST